MKHLLLCGYYYGNRYYVLITACGYDSGVKCTAVAWFISLICCICDWPLTELRNGALRLAAGGHSVSTGFLEMYYDSQWGSICSEGWESVDTSVACSQLGFPDIRTLWPSMCLQGTLLPLSRCTLQTCSVAEQRAPSSPAVRTPLALTPVTSPMLLW